MNPVKLAIHSALVALFVVSAAPAAADPQRPNILLILIDDLGWKAIGCAGSTYYETPHINDLAAKGCVSRAPIRRLPCASRQGVPSTPARIPPGPSSPRSGPARRDQMTAFMIRASNAVKRTGFWRHEAVGACQGTRRFCPRPWPRAGIGPGFSESGIAGNARTTIRMIAASRWPKGIGPIRWAPASPGTG